MRSLCDYLGVADMEMFRVPNFPMYLRLNLSLGCLETMSRGEWKKLLNVDAIYSILMNPFNVIKRPLLTASEIAICKNMDATYASRDCQPNDSFVSLWDDKPELYDFDKYQCEGHLVGTAHASRFPSLKPGEWASVEEAENWGSQG